MLDDLEEIIKFIHCIHIILQSIFFQCQFGIQQRWFFCQPVKINNIIRIIKDDRGITFLVTDNKNGVLSDIDDNGVCGGLIHTELEIKIVVHDSILSTDILQNRGAWNAGNISIYELLIENSGRVWIYPICGSKKRNSV